MDHEERNKIITENKALVYYLTRRYKDYRWYEDLTQHVFMQVTKFLPKFDPGLSISVNTFIGVITRSAVASYFKLKRERFVGDFSMDVHSIKEAEADGWHELLADDGLMQDDFVDLMSVREITESMPGPKIGGKQYGPEEYWDLMCRAYVYGESFEELGEEYGCAKQRIHAVVSRAKNRINRRIGLEVGRVAHGV